MVSGRVHDCRIYNNTVRITPSFAAQTQNPLPPAFWIRGKKYVAIEVYNNIFYATGEGQRTARIENPNLDPGLTTFAPIYVTLDYNDYFNPNSPGQKSIFYLDLNTSSKVHTLNDLRKDVRGAQEIHGMVDDPMLDSQSRLMPDSPLIDHGMTINAIPGFGSTYAQQPQWEDHIRDFFGTQVPQGDAFDIGASEFPV
jgi:hypothetical protein